jgi:hypothetical protein
MRTRSLIIALSVAALVLALAEIAVAADPFIGTWKLHVSKSKGNPTPKSQIAKITAQKGEYSWMFETVEADGKATSGKWSGKYDGKDYALTGNPGFDTVATKRINANTLESVLKKSGKVVGSGQETVTKDGRRLTIAAKQRNAQGQNVDTISDRDH